MSSGVLRVDDISDLQLKVPDHSRRPSSNLSCENRSSSGVSSITHSPISSNFDSLEERFAYSNQTFDEDKQDNISSSKACSGVLSVQDDPCIHYSKDSSSDLKPAVTKQAFILKEGIISRCCTFLRNKWRSVPVSMVPVRRGNDEKPLSPRLPDENGNQVERGPTTSAQPSVPKTPFSCTPIYVLIILILIAILIFGAVTTILDARPEFLYGPKNSNISLNTNNSVN